MQLNFKGEQTDVKVGQPVNDRAKISHRQMDSRPLTFRPLHSEGFRESEEEERGKRREREE